MGLRKGIGVSRSIKKGDKIRIYFPPAVLTASGGTNHPTWNATVVDVNDDALFVDRGGTVVALSWDHIAGMEFT